MKKSTLALSIAAALGGLGTAGNALAVQSFTPATGTDKIVVNTDGHGHKLLFPYFSVQNGNATLLTITNTNTSAGKLVKVRFRGAGNSDDLYDFQVALSPGDVWTAAVSQHSSGAAQLSTSDKSCTVPGVVSGAFNTDRVDGRNVAQTREGYVEVINMADIPLPATGATSALYNAIKHVSGVAPCTAATLLTLLGTDDTASNLKSGRGMSEPTTGLTGDWIIINQNTTAAWSGSATALEVQTSGGTPTTGNIVFWPQTLGTPNGWTTANTTMTADPLLTTGLVAIQNYDLPDMSTAYVANGNSDTAAEEADNTSAVLAVRSIRNQYATETAINGVTDILFSQPMRRYAAAVNYRSTTVTDSNGNTLVVPFSTAGTRAQPIFRGANPSSAALTSTTISNVAYSVAAAGGGNTAAQNLASAIGTGNAYYGPTSNAKSNASLASNLAIPSGQRNLCLYSINGAGTNTIWDREETTPGASAGSTTSFVISPSTPTTTTTSVVTVCGEAAVISINNGASATRSAALSASIALSDMSASSLTSYQAGWVVFNTGAGANNVVNPDNQNGLPILGGSFLRAANGAVNYGFHYTNKVTR